MKARRVASALVASLAGVPVNVAAKPVKPSHSQPASQRATTLRHPAPVRFDHAHRLAGTDPALKRAREARKACQPYLADIQRAERATGLPTGTLEALLYTESRCQPRARNPRTGAAGIAQFVPSGRRAAERATGRRFTAADVLTPEIAIEVAAGFLAYLVDRCGSLMRGLGAYASGSCARGLARARHVLRFAAWLRLAYGEEPRT